MNWITDPPTTALPGTSPVITPIGPPSTPSPSDVFARRRLALDIAVSLATQTAYSTASRPSGPNVATVADILRDAETIDRWLEIGGTPALPPAER